MVSVPVIFWGVFIFILVYFSCLYFVLIFNETIISLALAGYDMNIANLVLHASSVAIYHPGIIVN